MNVLMDIDFDIFSVCVAYSHSKANEHFNYIKPIFKMFIMMIDYDKVKIYSIVPYSCQTIVNPR